MKTIRTGAAPVPAGHSPQAVEHDGVGYLSGQLQQGFQFELDAVAVAVVEKGSP
jgi:hypothetical protein